MADADWEAAAAAEVGPEALATLPVRTVVDGVCTVRHDNGDPQRGPI